MRFKKLKDSYYEAIKSADNEVLHNDDGKRPYIILVDLIYKGKEQTFAVPCRSNINSSVQNFTYFTLPRRHTTRSGNTHGLHYIKMVPVNKKLTENVKVYDNSERYLNIINANKDIIKNELQYVLDEYSNGKQEKYCTNLDTIFPIYEECLEKAKSYDKLKINLKSNILKGRLLSVDTISEIIPQDYVIIKNGHLKTYELIPNEVENHVTLKLYAQDNFGQIKSIDIDVFIRDVDSSVANTTLLELEENKSKQSN